MNTEQEKIQSLLGDIACANGSLATQTLLHIMNRYLAQEEVSIREAMFYMRITKGAASSVASSPDWWTYKGRFSEALYDEHYIKEGRDGFGIYADLMGILKKLDEAYGENFSVESAVHYLRDVVEYADYLRHDLSELAA